MIKLVYCIRRKESLSREAFSDYWKNTHGPIVREAAQAMNVRRYVQSHAVDNKLGDAMAAARGIGGETYDGVTEIWWDSIEAFEAASASAAASGVGEMLLKDEKGFIDFARSAFFLTEECEIVPLDEAAT